MKVSSNLPGKVGRGSSSWSHHRKKICGITEIFLYHWNLPWSEGFRLSLCVSNHVSKRSGDKIVQELTEVDREHGAYLWVFPQKDLLV